MDSARQLIRYGIPGAVLLLTVAGTYVMLRLSLNLPPTSKEVPLSEALGPIGNNLSALTGIALSVPVGFMSYQLYHWTYRPLRLFGFVSANRGGEILSRLTADQRASIAESLRDELGTPRPLRDAIGAWPSMQAMVDDPFNWPAVRRNDRTGVLRMTAWMELEAVDDGARQHELARQLYKERWHRHHVVAAVLLDTTALGGRTAELKRQWTSVSDTYHAIGVTRTALISGVAVGGLANLLQVLLGRTGWSWGVFVDSTGAAVVILAAMMLFLGVLNHARFRAYRGSTTRLGHGLRTALAAQPELLTYLGGGSAGRGSVALADADCAPL